MNASKLVDVNRLFTLATHDGLAERPPLEMTGDESHNQRLQVAPKMIKRCEAIGVGRLCDIKMAYFRSRKGHVMASNLDFQFLDTPISS